MNSVHGVILKAMQDLVKTITVLHSFSLEKQNLRGRGYTSLLAGCMPCSAQPCLGGTEGHVFHRALSPLILSVVVCSLRTHLAIRSWMD